MTRSFDHRDGRRMFVAQEPANKNRRETLITVILGTRPEAIKLSPVVRALTTRTRVRLVLTGQHEEMVDDLIAELGLSPDTRLGVMRPRQTLNQLTAHLMDGLANDLVAHRPDALVVQGDTTTALCGALAGFHESVPVAHVEAGLRSYDRSNPFPEETNRCLIGQLAKWHFAPTRRAVQNLVAEGHCNDSIEMTGNTVIDSLLWVRRRGLGTSAFLGPADRRLLVTLHRRETQGTEMADLSRAVGEIARDLQLEVVLPVHRNPWVRESIIPVLGDHPNVRLVEPLGYLDFVATLADATLVLTDSGGVQEEAPTLCVPVLVARNVTERPEAVEANCARLVGTDPKKVMSAVCELITDRHAHSEMARVSNPFGDGLAGLRISERLVRDLTGEPKALHVRKHREGVSQCIST